MYDFKKKDLGKFLDSQTDYNQSKKEMLYKRWKERVFNPIQRQLNTHMDLSYSVLDGKKRELFSEYLSYGNKHPVFLDTMNKDEYDPLCWSQDKDITKVRKNTNLTNSVQIATHTRMRTHMHTHMHDTHMHTHMQTHM